LKTPAEAESRGHGTKTTRWSVTGLTKRSLESWEQTAFALRKEAAAKQNKNTAKIKKPAQQLQEAPAVAWEHNTHTPPPGPAALSTGGGGGLGRVSRLHALLKG